MLHNFQAGNIGEKKYYESKVQMCLCLFDWTTELNVLLNFWHFVYLNGMKRIPLLWPEVLIYKTEMESQMKKKTYCYQGGKGVRDKVGD